VDPAACEALPRVALPNAELCPHTHTATAGVDIDVADTFNFVVETAQVALEP
jgi:hypothetical protein